MYSLLAGVEFNRSSQVACRSLTLRGASALPRKSFLPGFLQTKLCLHVLSLVCVSEFCSCCRQENQRQREGFFFFFLYLTPQLQSAAVTKDSSYWLVCWPCGLFSERVGFRQHIFWHTHTRWENAGLTRVILLSWKWNISNNWRGRSTLSSPNSSFTLFWLSCKKFDLFSRNELGVIWRLAHLSTLWASEFKISCLFSRWVAVSLLSSCVFAWNQINNTEGS